MSNKILFFNIGNRDVKLDGKDVSKNQIRIKGKEVLNNLNEYRDKISIELISPFLNKFADAKKVYLFVTNQEDIRYNSQDTLYFGRIIQKIIEENYKIECEIKEYIHNPTNYELVFDFFINFFKNFDNSTIKIISNSGGIPAMKLSILLVATSFFNNLEVYSVDEKTNQLKEVQYKNTIKKEFIKKSALEFLYKKNYSSIISLLEKNRLENKKLIHLLKYAYNRLNFNFDASNKEINLFLGCINELEKRDFYEFTITKRSKKDHIAELYFNMSIKWNNEEYHDFLARLYRFREAFCFYLIFIATGKDIEGQSKEESTKKFDEFLSDYPDIKKGIDKDRMPDERKIFSVIKHFAKTKSGHIDIGKIHKINELCRSLRNTSIIAHGYSGISKEKILEEYRSNDVLTDVREMCLRANIPIANDPFDSINSHLAEIIKNL